MAYFLNAVKRRPSGVFLLTHQDGVGDSNEDTTQCVHCDMHWTLARGSGIARGFCLNCHGYTCGKQLCETRCRPAEQLVEEIEARATAVLQRDLNIREIRGY